MVQQRVKKLKLVQEDEIPHPVIGSEKHPGGYALASGRKETMEDFVILNGCFGERVDVDLYCVFDGHGGEEPAQFAAREFPKVLWDQLIQVSIIDDSKVKSSVETNFVECCQSHRTPEHFRVALALHHSFREISRQMIEKGLKGGTTALVTLFLGEDVFIANVGDTRCVMSQKDGKMVQITKDHKPEDEEKERIEKMGGFVSNLSVPRVNGLLAISRSLGNADLISKGVICSPSIRCVPDYRSSHRYMVLASDGLWDYVKYGEVSKVVNEVLGYKVAAWKPRRGKENSSNLLDTIPGEAFPFCCERKIDERDEEKSEEIFQMEEEGIFEFDDFDDPTDDSESIASSSDSCIWERIGLPAFPSSSQTPTGNDKEMDACDKLIHLAFDENSHDNISVILLNFV